MGVPDLIRSSKCKLHFLNTKTSKNHWCSDGRVKFSADPADFSADTLGPFNPDLPLVLEEEIRDLVLSLIELGVLPYTSCAGHSLDGSIHEAHVGILALERDWPRIIKALPDLIESGFTLFKGTLIDAVSQKSYETVEIYVLATPLMTYPSYRKKVALTLKNWFGR